MQLLKDIIRDEIPRRLTLEFFDVGAGTECLLDFTQEGDDTDLWVFFVLGNGRDDLLAHGMGQGVEVGFGV